MSKDSIKMTKLSITLPEELVNKLKAESIKEKRSLSAQIAYYLEKLYADMEGKSND